MYRSIFLIPFLSVEHVIVIVMVYCYFMVRFPFNLTFYFISEYDLNRRAPLMCTLCADQLPKPSRADKSTDNEIVIIAVNWLYPAEQGRVLYRNQHQGY